jgi:hypothetical protein
MLYAPPMNLVFLTQGRCKQLSVKNKRYPQNFLGHVEWIITMDWLRQQVSSSDPNRDYITSIEYISGDRKVLPPLIVV